MLGNLVSYIFGSETEVPADGCSDGNVMLHLREDDDDWVLIDKTEEERQQASVELAERISSVPVESDSTMECSWYVTPPPCFTSTSGPLATDPMETLLLEHPSMSVYETGTSSIRPSRTVAEEEDEEVVVLLPPTPTEEEPTPPSSTNSPTPPRLRTSNTSVQTAPRAGVSAATLAARVGMLQQTTLLRETQKAQQHRSQRFLKRTQMNRSNKSREYASTGKRHRRRDFMKKHSGMNNNRRS